jgi:membrane associated rhomboid family serine protease
MIPLRDENPSRHFPIVNYAMIALCALGFAGELSAGPRVDEIFESYALVPARFLALAQRGHLFDLAIWTPFATSMFLHAGWMHFLGNMLYLWIFGDNVEDWLGSGRYLLFYLAGGVVAGLAHVFSNATSLLPTVGASGAIAAVMGAYLVLHPRAQIQSLIIIFFYVRIVPVHAWVYLGFWFVLQLVSGTQTLGSSSEAQGGVAWWAHAGGFAFGALCAIALGRRPLRRARGRA